MYAAAGGDVYRLHFTSQDLLRVRLTAPPGAFAETALAAEQLRQSAPGLVFRAWRSGLRGRLTPRARALTELFASDGPGLDLSTMVGPVDSMAEGLNKLHRVRRETLAAELRWLAERQRLTRWARGLAHGDREPRRELADALADFHESAVRPHWSDMRAQLRADRAARLHALAAHGLDHTLRTICPGYVRWRNPVLEVNNPYADDADIHLGGRGLALVPSIFVGRRPYLAFDLTDESAPPQLVYPVLRDLTVARRLWRADRPDRQLAALLGRTRSAVLQNIADGLGTTEIARRLGVSAATVSEHAAVLRANDLIGTIRDGPNVRHVLTALGAALLGDKPGSP